MTVYITSTGAFLPGPPISVGEVEGILGAVHGKPSSLRVQIQKANKIETRHYAIDANQKTTHSNTEMASNAAEQCLDRAFLTRDKVGMLAVASTQGDLPAPGMASMVQAELGLPAIEILTTHGICSSSMMALKAAWNSLRLGDHEAAVVVSSELSSRLLKKQRYEAATESNTLPNALISTLNSSGGCSRMGLVPYFYRIILHRRDSVSKLIGFTDFHTHTLFQHA